ncbi:FAD-dependent oxidoreductase [Reyranella sp.]|uniref:FAD-dependent oxidoreductase n=1 Tax=Reyranella sp. TaxID=1929291 RepID=UPI003BA8A39F
MHIKSPSPAPSAPVVLISGAGAAGLTLAIDLARRGVAFRLIDKAAEPFPGSRGKGIQPRSQEVFEDLGVLDRMVAVGGRYPMLRTYAGDRVEDVAMMEERPVTPAEPYVTPLMLPQARTEAVLRERLAELGHHAEFACELLGFEQDGEGVTARLSAGGREETLRVAYLVGADGGRSFARHALDIGFPGETLPVRALVADLDLEGLSRDRWHRWNITRGDQLSLCPLGGTDLFQLQAGLVQPGEPDLSAPAIERLIAERTGRTDLTVHAVRWASGYGMNVRLADRYRVGRVFLAGDAAHVHPPTGGQGLNTSVQDAYNLGWKLAAVLAGAPESLLATYEAERRPVAAHVLGLARSLLQAARERGEMRRGRETHELDIGYFDSSLALDARGRSGTLAAGGRAPDAPCRGAAGQPLRLFNLLLGPQWTLLGYEVERASLGPARAGLAIHTVGVRGDIVDADGHIRTAYDLTPGDRVLIRPDGYVGAFVDGDGQTALEDYLAKVGLTGG